MNTQNFGQNDDEFKHLTHTLDRSPVCDRADTQRQTTFNAHNHDYGQFN